MASRTNDKEIQNQIETFRQLDKNNDGYITLSELKSVLRGTIEESDLQEMLSGVDTDQNGAINYTEFIAATLNKTHLKNTAKLKKAFTTIDLNGDG